MTDFALVPEQFTLVEFDAARVLELAHDAAAAVGFPDDVDVSIEVDEVLPAPLNGSQVDVRGDRVELWFTGGSFEDTHRGRILDEELTRTALGASLLRAMDRLSGAFADAPVDAELSERLRAIWDVYTDGRLARLGFAVKEPRRRYVYRLECGFNDVADAEYAQCWNADALTWTDLVAVEERCTAADPRERPKRTPVRRESLRQV